MFYRHILGAAAGAFVLLSTAALPSHAQGQQGAQCPPDTPTADFRPQFQNNRTLRCQRFALAPTFCPATHPVYDARNGADICRLTPGMPVAIGVAPTYEPQCPPAMNRVDDAGPGNRDVCRSTGSTLVMPLLGMY
jgi:hypothetical protein